MRYRESDWWHFARKVARNQYITPEGFIKSQLYPSIEIELLKPHLDRYRALVRKDPAAEKTMVSHFARLDMLRHWVVIAAQFEACGRQIFDLPSHLVEMLNNTDVSECTLAGWHPPYNAFFLHFGPQDDFKREVTQESNHPERLDGAFVAISPTDYSQSAFRIRLGLTATTEIVGGMTLPGYFLDFHPNVQHLPVHEAIDAAVAARAQELRETTPSHPRVQALGDATIAEFHESADMLKRASALVFNALFYVESLKGAYRNSPGKGVPPELVEKWEKAKGRQQDRLTSKLTSEGYAIVKLLGSELVVDSNLTRAAIGSVRTHWRRGHWREQPYGPGMQFRRRTWIKPVIVRAERSEGDMPGHIYKC